MFDDNELFYATVNEENVFDFFKHKTLIYSRITREYFDNNSIFIQSSSLTEIELAIHRPDLPLRLNCFSELFWSDKPFNNEIECTNFLKSSGVNIQDLKGLKSCQVVVIPTSQLQSQKNPVLLTNEDGSFSGQELMTECFNIQSEYVKPDKLYFSRLRKDSDGLSGIGIYRLGIKGNVPSYYLGGELSMMEYHILKN